MKLHNKTDHSAMTRKIYNIKKPGDWLAVLRAIKTILTTANREDRCRMGIALFGIAPTIDLPDPQLLNFFEVSRADLEKEVPPACLKERGLFVSLMLSPQLSPVCRQFNEAWTTLVLEIPSV